ncbi:hypothetical protein M0R72_15635 [Candidatus Pacearchaeota archaeon]|jgi:hypothetical protein|nr:hypothetical protein [Candidatus Pacearchaeota archaeon]
MSRFRDFDTFRAESKEEPLRFSMRGVEFELPPSISAALALDIMRKHSDDPNKKIEGSEIADFAEKLFGKSQLNKLLSLEPPISFDDLSDIVKWVIAEYGRGSDQGNPTPLMETGEERKNK